MAVRTRFEQITGRTPTYGVRTTITTQIHPDDLRSLDIFATEVIECGAARMQTYRTADQCRAIARAYLQAAADLDLIAPVIVAREAA